MTSPLTLYQTARRLSLADAAYICHGVVMAEAHPTFDARSEADFAVKDLAERHYRELIKPVNLSAEDIRDAINWAYDIGDPALGVIADRLDTPNTAALLREIVHAYMWQRCLKRATTEIEDRSRRCGQGE